MQPHELISLKHDMRNSYFLHQARELLLLDFALRISKVREFRKLFPCALADLISLENQMQSVFGAFSASPI
jgi:hypothetical protein